MGSHRVAGAPLDFAALRTELAVPGDFSLPVAREAIAAAAQVELSDEDASAIPFVTVDPAGSKDLDQAVHLAREGSGYLVSYAIADVASFVVPGSALDAETFTRGETLYFPDARVPLHPPVLSEDAASLRPDQVRPAVLWRMTLDSTGEVTDIDVRRARVRSRAQLDYVGLQQHIASGDAPDAVRLLPEVGRLRQLLARRRHAINLNLPEQNVVADSSNPGQWTIVLRAPLPVEDYNAEISLLTGMCAAHLMLDSGYGILRTVPPADARTIDRLRRAASAVGIPWAPESPPGDVLATVNPTDPHHVAFLEHAASLLRGSGYTTFEGAAPDQPIHAGIGAPYAHVTAPLRRLVDRYASEICLAAYAKTGVPDWVRSALTLLPNTMAAADSRAHAIDRAVVDATEAWLLQGRIGETFVATVLDANSHSATVVLDDPVVRAKCTGDNLAVGTSISVRLAAADVTKREVEFVPAT
jgi:exoribonuclease R